MLRYWHSAAPIEAKELCRLPMPGPSPMSLISRGLSMFDLEFIEECYLDLREDIRKALLH